MLGDKKNIGILFGHLGNIYANEMIVNPFKDIPKGIMYYQQALEIFRENCDTENEIFWLIKTGKAYISLTTGDRNNNLDQAVKFLTVARDKLFKISDKVDKEHDQFEIIRKDMHESKESAEDPVKNDLLRSFKQAYSELKNEELSNIYDFLIPKSLGGGAADNFASLKEYLASERYHWLSRMHIKPVMLADMATIIDYIQSHIDKSGYFQLSVSYPRLFSKRYDSVIHVQLYLPENRQEIIAKLKKLSIETGGQGQIERIYDTTISPDLIVITRLFSPDIEFSDQVTKLLGRGINQIQFIAKPKESCQTDKPHAVKLSVSEKANETELESIVFQVKVTDFAFDHISRPTLSKIVSVISAIGSIIVFVLTLLGQIDTTFGLTSGTISGLLAAFIYANFLNLYKHSKTTVNSP